MAFEVLCMSENFLEHFIVDFQRITGSGKKNNDFHFQFSLHYLFLFTTVH